MTYFILIFFKKVNGDFNCFLFLFSKRTPIAQYKTRCCMLKIFDFVVQMTRRRAFLPSENVYHGYVNSDFIY